jgi:hypothetical protein
MLLSPGTLIYAHGEAGVARPGEVGVCYEVYTLKGEMSTQEGYSLIFEGGGYDGFSLFDLTLAVTPLEAHCLDVRSYAPTTVSELSLAYHQGRFQAAFVQAKDYLTAHGWLKDRHRFLLWLHAQVHGGMARFLSSLDGVFSARVTLEGASVQALRVVLFDEYGVPIVLPSGYEPGWTQVKRKVEYYLAPLKGTFHYYLHSAVSPSATFKDAFVIPFPTLAHSEQGSA